MDRDIVWNRSSTWDPETLGAINGIMSKAIQDASVALVNATKDMDVSDEDRAEALRIVGENVAKGIHDALEQWKDSHRQPRRKK